MKIYLAYNTIDGPYGGANQFFRSLAKEFTDQGVLATSPADADAIIFNSHTPGGRKGNGPAIITQLKYRFPKTIFIHRVDGPVSVYRGDDRYRFVDRLVYQLNNDIADGTVYQSKWSRQANLELGKKPTAFAQTILNAPDPTIFYPATTHKDVANRKIKLIASSFSNHPNKGFAIYQWLDQNLDWSRYEMTFVGNSPVEFKNITNIGAVDPQKLATILRGHDIYLTASQKDPCSNALIEAMHCGLPPLALRDGGHPEIVGSGGELFTDKAEIPALLDRVTSNYKQYQTNNDLPSISDVAEQYQLLVGNILQQVQDRKYVPKKLLWSKFWYKYVYYRVSRLIRIICSKLFSK